MIMRRTYCSPCRARLPARNFAFNTELKLLDKEDNISLYVITRWQDIRMVRPPYILMLAKLILTSRLQIFLIDLTFFPEEPTGTRHAGHGAGSTIVVRTLCFVVRILANTPLK